MATSRKKLIINNTPIALGDNVIINIEMPKLYDCTPISMPVHVIRGKKPGSTLCVIAAVHGDEINGIEIIKLLLKKLRSQTLSGTLIAVPIINVYGFLYQTRYLMDRRDLNRCFPGSNAGSLASRLAHLVMSDVIDNATHIIDLHTGSLHRANYPQIRANLSESGVKKMAKAFNAPIILSAGGPNGSLRSAAEQRKKPIIVYEAGEALRFDDLSIQVGVKGVMNVMESLGMIEKKDDKPTKSTSVIAQSSYWIRASHSGIIRAFRSLGDKIIDGEILGTISNPVGDEEYHVAAPHGGTIIGISNIPIVHEGAALFHIACFEKIRHPDEELKQLHISLDPNLEANELSGVSER